MSLLKAMILTLGLVTCLSKGTALASQQLNGPWVHPYDRSQRIITINTDAFPGTTVVEVSRDELTGELKTLTCFTEDGRITTFTLEQLRQFQTVKKVKDRDAVYLKVDTDFEPIHGGHATLRFLQNGLWGTYKNFRMLIDVQGDSIVLRSEPNSKDPDSDRNPYTSVFNHLFMRKNTVLGQVAGIDEIVPSLR